MEYQWKKHKTMTHFFVFWCFFPLEADNHSRCTELIEVNFLPVGSTLGRRGTDVTTITVLLTHLKSSSVFSSICWWSTTKYSVLQSSLFCLWRGAVLCDGASNCKLQTLIELVMFGQQLFVGSPSKQVSGHGSTRIKDDCVKCFSGCCSWPESKHKME